MKIKAKELKQKTQEELKMMLKENREKIRSLRFDLASKKLKKTNELGEARKMAAQILTVLNRK
ncbi:MAG: 50S ribosomal protein L29 [Candidatus Portnoybacteria bacterium]|nr:50S ribosomal protein L29 [Candidatus Portnoybacteria bacterium]MDD4982577.1 50S ribosomal protein L29 [Candidatus Portnoybacteria bacterium]